jgi:glycosidase
MYKPEATRVQLNLLDSHDTPRFLTCAGHDLNSLKLALTFLFTYPGAPCIFYGDEVGLSGRHDPECRQPFPWDEGKWNHDLLDFVKGLIKLRKSHPSLRWGKYERLYSHDGIYCFKRKTKEETILIGLNAAEATHSVDLGVPTSTQAKPRILFGQAEIEQENKAIKLTIPARSNVVVKI